MIVVLQKFGVDTGTENQYIPINVESIEVGNITVKPNGNKTYISVTEWLGNSLQNCTDKSPNVGSNPTWYAKVTKKM